MESDLARLSMIPDHMRDSYAVVSDLVEWNKDSYGGLWYDEANKVIVLDVTDDRSIEKASRALGDDKNVAFREVQRSHDDLMRMWLDLAAGDYQIPSWGTSFDPSIEGLRVHLTADDTDLEDISSRAAKIGLPVSFDRAPMDGPLTMTDSRGSDPSPFAGGMKYGMAPSGPVSGTQS